jgi:hypothetical protein
MTQHVHPAWCGHGHVCSIDSPAGEHRSHPVTVDGTTTRLVVTRTRSRTGRDRIEVRLIADLPHDPRRAKRTVALIVTGVHHAATRAQLLGGAG